MKKKIVKSKLSLGKNVISNLTEGQKQQIQGGLIGVSCDTNQLSCASCTSCVTNCFTSNAC